VCDAGLPVQRAGDVGSGRSTTPAELYGFGLGPGQSRAQWQRASNAVTRLLAEEQVELDGEFVRCLAHSWCRAPVAEAAPAMWVGGVGPARRARRQRRGWEMLFFARKTEYDGLAASTGAITPHRPRPNPFVGWSTSRRRGSSTACVVTTAPRCRNLAARKTVGCTRCTGFDWMSEGWPGGQPGAELRTSGSGDIAMLRDAAKADPTAIGEFMVSEAS